MARKSFAELKASIGKKTGGSSDYDYGDVYPFWNMNDGEEAIVRFLPDKNEDNDEGFMLEKFVHKFTINGQYKTVLCPKHHGGGKCPACDISAEYYDADDKASGKKFYRDMNHIARAVIVADPLDKDAEGKDNVGKIMTINLSFQVYNAIINSFNDLEDYPFDYENGCNFIITKQMVKDGEKSYANYSFSKFARKETPISKYIKEEDIKLLDLTTLLPKVATVEEMETYLEAAIQGADNDSTAPKKSDSIGALKDKLGTVTDAPAEKETASSEDNISDAANDILNDIMAQNAS